MWAAALCLNSDIQQVILNINMVMFNKCRVLRLGLDNPSCVYGLGDGWMEVSPVERYLRVLVFPNDFFSGVTESGLKVVQIRTMK